MNRVIFGFVLLIVTLVVFTLGPIATGAFVIFTCALVLDECLVYFFKGERFSQGYWISMGTYIVPVILMSFLTIPIGFLTTLLLLLNIYLLRYLFTQSVRDTFFFSKLADFPIIASLYFLLPVLCLLWVLKQEFGLELFLVLLVINVAVDTGAWFFGKLYGKRKLFEEVSPKKTIEGLIGGMVSGSILGSIVFQYTMGRSSIGLVFIFLLIGLISQLGDLVESKLKRQAGLKDSSTLIPGHGGVYDRIDGLIFTIPFYILTVILSN